MNLTLMLEDHVRTQGRITLGFIRTQLTRKLGFFLTLVADVTCQVVFELVGACTAETRVLGAFQVSWKREKVIFVNS